MARVNTLEQRLLSFASKLEEITKRNAEHIAELERLIEAKERRLAQLKESLNA